MVKAQQQEQAPVESTQKQTKSNSKSKYNRFDSVEEVDSKKRATWPTDAVVYIGHIPHGFYEDQLKTYFTQYGEVLAVKVARSRKTARSKGYAFVQFKYPEVATIVSQTMNRYMLMGKILVANTLPVNQKNPFTFSTSKQFKFVNWKRIFMQQKNKIKTGEETKKEVEGLLKKEEQKKEKLKAQGIDYDYPGFKSCIKVK